MAATPEYEGEDPQPVAPAAMSTLPELARRHTALDEDDITHCNRLVASWGILADLCFADLLLFVPTTEGRFLVLGQMRPSTTQTVHHEDLIGRTMDDEARPLVGRAFRAGEMMDGEVELSARGGELARIQCIPVRRNDRVIGVMTRESALLLRRRPGELERAYLGVFERFARMVASGAFPYPVDEGTTAESPRVGDGVMLLDETGRVVYASPNAISGLHRAGVYTNAEGTRLHEVGVDTSVVEDAWATKMPATQEVERRPDVVVLIRCLPLLDHGRVTGGTLLLRDVTDLRRRDRQLLSKDATIREVHHRVKNNLQTIGSLLRLQGRRLPPGEGRQALREAEARIRSIAVVHEFLSRDAGEQVDFTEIVQTLTREAEMALLEPGRRVRFELEGAAGVLPAALATPLAVVINELLQNAVEHGFPEPDTDGRVVIDLSNDGGYLVVCVKDNGVGFPPGFSIGQNRVTLGLAIARDLVTTQLNGTIDTGDADGGGAVVRLTLPVD